jgi:hypothetical protein
VKSDSGRLLDVSAHQCTAALVADNFWALCGDQQTARAKKTIGVRAMLHRFECQFRLGDPVLKNAINFVKTDLKALLNRPSSEHCSSGENGVGKSRGFQNRDAFSQDLALQS